MTTQEILNSLPSRSVSSARKGVGSFVTIDVGQSHGNPTAWDLHVWIYLCDWELLIQGRPTISSDSSSEAMDQQLSSLIGSELQRIEVEAPGVVEIHFSEDRRFVLRENLQAYDAEDDLLLLFPHGSRPVGYKSSLGFYTDESENSASPRR